jgi:plasmid segregation protein ParM
MSENKTVRTETLAEGTLFVSPDGVLYQVVMAGSAGFRKAERWPWLPQDRGDAAEGSVAVALVPGSLLARNYPTVAEGTPLPWISRADILGPDGEPGHYVFGDERFARLAAQLDEVMTPQSGLAARKERHRWVLSDGRQVFRVYHYQIDRHAGNIDLTGRFAEESIQALPCERGPFYWQYIPGWEKSPVVPLEGAGEAAAALAEAAEPTLESTDEATPAEANEAPVAPESVASPTVEEAEPQPGLGAPPESEVERAGRAVPAAPSASETRRTPAMILSIDIGYGYTKGVGPNDVHFAFPSVIGTAEDIRFSTDLIHGGEDRPVKYGNWRFFYGQQAVLQSRVQSAIFDRSRVHDDTYKLLFVAALVELSKSMPDIDRLKVITGLPVEFFGDRPEVVKSFEGVYRVTTEQVLKFAVDSVVVAPQPFGSLFRELLNEQGKISNDEVERGRVGVIDVGTFTTDFVVSDDLRYVQRLSGSIRIGWNTVVRQVQQALADLHMLELELHEVDRAIQDGEVRVRGEPVSLDSLIDPAVTDIQTAIIARARDLWGEGANLDMILVSGGGGPYLYDTIKDTYPHARLLDKAFWANAEGLYRFGMRPATFER